MRRIPRALGIAGITILCGCDSFFVEPATAAPEVRFTMVPATTAGVVYGDLRTGLAPVQQVHFQFVRDGVARDTLVKGIRTNPNLLEARVLLRPEEALGWLEVIAELQMATGATTLRGHALVDMRAVVPEATIEVEPVAAMIEGPGIATFRALGAVTLPTAVPAFANFTPIIGAVVDWTSDDPSIVEALGTAGIAARGNGTTVVRASALGATREYVVVVQQRPVTFTGVGPADTTIAVGATFQGRPFGEDGNGQALRPGAEVIWASSGSVSVTAEGIVSANSPGVGVVTASRDAITHIMNVTVVP